MQLWQHSGIPVRFFPLNPEDVRNVGLGVFWTFIKGKGFPLLDFSVRDTKGLSKAYADRDRKGSNPLRFVFYSLHTTHSSFDVLLTLHLSIIFVINQLHAQILVL